jgi:hypothetical protein
MKFLCLAYGNEDGWNTLTEQEKAEVLAQDERLKNRGDVLAAVQPTVTTITNWNGKLLRQPHPYSPLSLPLAGFSVVEASSVDVVIALVSNSPCARAQGAIEIRPFWDFASKTPENDGS